MTTQPSAAEGLPPNVLQPIPRRAFERHLNLSTATASSTPSIVSTPAEPDDPDADSVRDEPPAPSRTKSLLNLTSSTLFGIYSPATATTTPQGERDESPMPLGLAGLTPHNRLPYAVKAEKDGESMSSSSKNRPRPHHLSPTHHNHTPHHHHHHQQHVSWPYLLMRLVLRTVLLFGFGAVYGVIITHLHDNQKLAPVEMIGVHSFEWSHSLFWGIAGVSLGSLLPWIDVLWEDKVGSSPAVGRTVLIGEQKSVQRNEQDDNDRDANTPTTDSSSVVSTFGTDWYSIVRSIGAFVGIAFAIVSPSSLTSLFPLPFPSPFF